MTWCTKLFGEDTLLHSKTARNESRPSEADDTAPTAADQDDAAASVNYALQLGEPTVPIATLAQHKIVFLYFSASWCQPCIRFTPLLANLYKEVNKAKTDEGEAAAPELQPAVSSAADTTITATEQGDTKDRRTNPLEIVFITLDESNDDFQSYFQTHHGPWLALPYAQLQRRRQLIRKFGVRQIPTLVVLDGATGRVLNRNAVKEATAEKAIERYPFPEKKILDVLRDTALVKANGSLLQVEELSKMPVFCLYFAAQWSPPCRAFTPTLVSIYNQVKENPARANTEIIFVSSDKDSTAYDDITQLIPFARVAFQDPASGALRQLCNVSTLPALVMCDATGSVIQYDGRQAAADDPNGEQYPWVQEPLPVVSDLVGSSQVVQALNETICFTLKVNGAANEGAIKEEFKKAAIAAMQRYFPSGKASVLKRYRNPYLESKIRTLEDAVLDDDDEVLDVHFFVVPEVDVALMIDRVVAAVGAETPGAGSGPFVLATFLKSDVEHMATKRETLTGDLSAANIGALVDSFLARQKKAATMAATETTPSPAAS